MTKVCMLNVCLLKTVSKLCVLCGDLFTMCSVPTDEYRADCVGPIVDIDRDTYTLQFIVKYVSI